MTYPRVQKQDYEVSRAEYSTAIRGQIALDTSPEIDAKIMSGALMADEDAQLCYEVFIYDLEGLSSKNLLLTSLKCLTASS